MCNIEPRLYLRALLRDRHLLLLKCLDLITKCCDLSLITSVGGLYDLQALLEHFCVSARLL